MSSVRRWQPGDLDACLAIVRGLPDYFTGDVLDAVRHDFVRHQAWTAVDGEPVGFTVVDRRSDAAAEILWAAVHPARRAAGLPAVRGDPRVLGAQGLRPGGHDRPDAGLAAGQPVRAVRRGARRHPQASRRQTRSPDRAVIVVDEPRSRAR